jgi:CRP-like cAMP-binding protein
MTAEIKEFLRKNHIFRHLPGEKLDAIARTVRKKHAPGGSLIFHEGEVPKDFFIVASGKVRIFLGRGDAAQKELAVLGPGDGFGEVGLLTGEPRSASAQSQETSLLLVLSKEDFDRIVEEFPDLGKKFMKGMRDYLMKDREIIEEGERAAARASSQQMSWFDFLLILGVSILLALSFNRANPNGIDLFPALETSPVIARIGPAEAFKRQRLGQALLVDAMPPNFYKQRHIRGAVNMPISLFDIVYLMNFSEEKKDREILVYGETISRPYAREIAAKLQLLGYTDVKLIRGGLPGWEKDGYPVEGEAG